MLFKLLPLLALALLAFLGYKYCVTEPAHNNTAAVATPTPAAKPGAKAIDSSLNIAVRDGKYFLSGVIPDEKTKQEIIDKATAAYGAGNFDVSGLKIDANAKAPDWLGKLGDAFTALKGAANGAVLSFAGAGVKLEGLAGAAAQGLMDKLKGLFPTISLAVPVNEATAAEEAEKKAGDALSALPANFTVEQLAEAMNLQIINFPSGGATIPKDREDILTRSAEFIKKLPADAKLEVGGHTDNRGAAATNSALSAKRADAVKAFLVGKGVNAAALTTKGYGPEKPIASNDTDSGRFQNRRIEFTVAK
jgi:outer membrane protein OmpA-like peptidoglycan-associated protein